MGFWQDLAGVRVPRAPAETDVPVPLGDGEGLASIQITLPEKYPGFEKLPSGYYVAKGGRHAGDRVASLVAALVAKGRETIQSLSDRGWVSQGSDGTWRIAPSNDEAMSAVLALSGNSYSTDEIPGVWGQVTGALGDTYTGLETGVKDVASTVSDVVSGLPSPKEILSSAKWLALAVVAILVLWFFGPTLAKGLS